MHVTMSAVERPPRSIDLAVDRIARKERSYKQHAMSLLVKVAVCLLTTDRCLSRISIDISTYDSNGVPNLVQSLLIIRPGRVKLITQERIDMTT